MLMPDGMTFDELNALYNAEHENNMRSMPYSQYFGEMDITAEQKERRRESAEKLEEIFIFLLALVFYFEQDGTGDYLEAMAAAQEQYQALVEETPGLEVSDYFKSIHIPDAVNSVVETMLAHPENAFNFTIDRAMLIAENEANSMWNDAEFEEAVKSGKTTKTWHTIIDKRTRDWHADVNGETIPIMEPFVVNGELMNHPRDDTLGATAENIANCRCSVTYR